MPKCVVKWGMSQRPYKPLVMFIDIQALYAAPPSAAEIELLQKHGAYLPTPQEIKTVEDIIDGCNALADTLRGKVLIGWAAMAPKTSFLVTDKLAEFKVLLTSNGHTLNDFYRAEPRDGDVFVAKTQNSVMSNPEFMKFLEDGQYTHLYVGGFQTTKCALDSVLKTAVQEMFKETAANVQTAIISDLSTDTYAGNGSFRPMPSADEVQAEAKRFGARLITMNELQSEITASLGRPANDAHNNGGTTPAIS